MCWNNKHYSDSRQRENQSPASSNLSFFCRVTLDDGSQWLIHKGGGFGLSSQTVVTDARHMSSAWRVNLKHNTSVSIETWLYCVTKFNKSTNSQEKQTKKASLFSSLLVCILVANRNHWNQTKVKDV